MARVLGPSPVLLGRFAGLNTPSRETAGSSAYIRAPASCEAGADHRATLDLKLVDSFRQEVEKSIRELGGRV